jgi:hypothetical protein
MWSNARQISLSTNSKQTAYSPNQTQRHEAFDLETHNILTCNDCARQLALT